MVRSLGTPSSQRSQVPSQASAMCQSVPELSRTPNCCLPETLLQKCLLVLFGWVKCRHIIHKITEFSFDKLLLQSPFTNPL